MPRTKRNGAEGKKPEVPIDPTKCFIARLFNLSLNHVLEGIFLMLPLRDLDSCKAVCKQWNKFLKSNIWGSPKCRAIIMPKWDKKLAWNWQFAEPRVTHRFPLPEDHAHYRDVALVADSSGVIASLGNGLIVAWNRITMKRVLIDHEVRRHGAIDSVAPVIGINREFLAAAFFAEKEDAKVVLYKRGEDYRVVGETRVSGSRGNVPLKVLFIGNRFAVAFKNQVVAFVAAVEKDELQERFRIRKRVEGSDVMDLAVSEDGTRFLVAFDASDGRVGVYRADAGGAAEKDVRTNRGCWRMAPAPKGWQIDGGMLVGDRAGDVALLNADGSIALHQDYRFLDMHCPDLRPIREIQVCGDLVAVSTFLVGGGGGGGRNATNATNVTNAKRKPVLHLRKSEAKITVHFRRLDGIYDGKKREVASYSVSPMKAKGPSFVLEKDALVRLSDDGSEIIIQSYWHVDASATKKKMKAEKDKKREESKFAPTWRI